MVRTGVAMLFICSWESRFRLLGSLPQDTVMGCCIRNQGNLQCSWARYLFQSVSPDNPQFLTLCYHWAPLINSPIEASPLLSHYPISTLIWDRNVHMSAKRTHPQN